MPAPQPLYPNTTIILTPAYLPGIEHYAALIAHPQAILHCGMKFDKRQKFMHRCNIADTHGTISLTIPVEKPVSMSGARWSDIKISGHDHWWNRHLTTLKSAYGRTPFFEYYLNDLLPFYTDRWVGTSLTDYNTALDNTIRRLLGVPTQVTCSTDTVITPLPGTIVADHSRKPLQGIHTIPYYQVRSQKHGFIPSMSIVDLLFNMGPESTLILHKMLR